MISKLSRIIVSVIAFTALGSPVYASDDFQAFAFIKANIDPKCDAPIPLSISKNQITTHAFWWQDTSVPMVSNLVKLDGTVNEDYKLVTSEIIKKCVKAPPMSKGYVRVIFNGDKVRITSVDSIPSE